MPYLFEKAKVCFVGSFCPVHLQETLGTQYSCTFLEKAQITNDLLSQYDYVFASSNKDSQVLFYCRLPDPIEIDIDPVSAERCVADILNFGNGYISMDGADLQSALGCGSKTSFYNALSIDDAKQYIARSKSVVGIALKIYIPATSAETFGLDDVEKIAEEMLDICSEETYIIYNTECRPELADCTCDIFITNS